MKAARQFPSRRVELRRLWNSGKEKHWEHVQPQQTCVCPCPWLCCGQSSEQRWEAPVTVTQGAAQKLACLKVSAKLHMAPKAAVITYLVSRDEFIAVLKLVWDLECCEEYRL